MRLDVEHFVFAAQWSIKKKKDSKQKHVALSRSAKKPRAAYSKCFEDALLVAKKKKTEKPAFFFFRGCLSHEKDKQKLLEEVFKA